MSLILEALKKSEAKRRLGEAPDLGTPFATPRRRGRALPLLVLAIVAAGAFGWWLLRPPAAPATTAPAPANVSTAAAHSKVTTPVHAPAPAVAKPAPMQPVAAAAAPARTPAAPPSESTRARSAEPPVFVAAQREPPGNVQKPHGLLGPGRRGMPSNMHRVAKAPAPATPAAQPAPPAVAAAATTPATAPPSAPLAKAQKAPDPRGVTPAPQSPAVNPPPPPPPSTPAPDAAPAQAKSDVQFYYELPFSIRKALPPLRLSMHVYAGDPAQRFVILNDLRLGEGDKTADEVTVREVRKDGAVLEFQGQRFFYPRDGL